MRTMLLERLQSKWLWIGCGVLFALLLAVAALQYSWINRLSEADRQQREEALDTSIRELRRDFNGTLNESMRIFRATPNLAAGTELESHLTNLSAQWREATHRPQLISAVGLAKVNSDGAIVFKTLRMRETEFAAQEWPGELTQFREILEKRLRMPGGEPPLFPRGFACELVNGSPVLAFPLVEGQLLGDEFGSRRPQESSRPTDSRALLQSLSPMQKGSAIHPPELKGWCFLEMNAEYLRTQLLPELIEQHFGRRGIDDYQLAVITGRDHQILYQASRRDVGKQAPGGKPPAGPAERPFSAALLASLDARATIFARQVQGPMPGVAPPQGPPPARLPLDGLEGPPRDRPPRRRPPPPPNNGSNDSPNGFPRPERPRPEQLVEPEDAEAWQLVVKYQAGWFEDTVTQTRWRNLVLSFGTLLILAGSIGLLALAAVRSRKLAVQQMEFVAGISHELRTPLAVIQSTSYNLAKGMIADARRVQQYGEVIQSESRRLINQVEQMLSFAGIQSGRQHYELRPARISEILERAFAEYAAAFAADGWQIEQNIQPDLPMVMADAQAMESVIKNLLQNALKYAAEGKFLRISTDTTQSGHRKEIQITIADRGPGIDPADLPHIFKPFYRGKKAWDSPAPGTGLGLSLVERHLQAHGGRVTVKPSPGGGTAFTLHLPCVSTSTVREGEDLQNQALPHSRGTDTSTQL